MATFGIIKTRAEQYILDVVPQITGNVGDWVNHGIRIAQETYNFRTMRTRLFRETTVGLRKLFNTPSDFKDFNKTELPFWEDETRKRRFVELIGAEDSRDLYTSDPTVDKGSPLHIRRTEYWDADAASQIDFMEIYPYPDGLGPGVNGEYDIAVPFFRYLPALTLDTQSNWFTDNAEWFLTWYATAQGLFLLREEERGLVYGRQAGINVATGDPVIVRGRFTGELGRVISTDKKIGARPVRTLELRLDAGHG